MVEELAGLLDGIALRLSGFGSWAVSWRDAYAIQWLDGSEVLRFRDGRRQELEEIECLTLGIEFGFEAQPTALPRPAQHDGEQNPEGD
jgi:hypothetical protein